MAEESTYTETATEAKLAPGVTDSDFAEAVKNPSSFSVDGVSQSNRSLSELIAADKYLRQRSRAARRRSPLSGIGIACAIPPGTCDR